MACRVVEIHTEMEQKQKPGSFSISNLAFRALQWCEGVNHIKHVSWSTQKEVPSCSSSHTDAAEAQPDHSAACTGCLSFSCKAITPAITGCLKYNQSPSSLLSGQSFPILLLQELPHYISKVGASACIWFQHTEALLHTGPCADCILKYLMESNWENPFRNWALNGEQETCSRCSIKINDEKPETHAVLLAQRKGMTSGVFWCLRPGRSHTVSLRVNTSYGVKIKLSMENEITTVCGTASWQKK